MTIRFNPDLYGNLVAGLNLTERDQAQAIQQLSTGRRVNAPSDDPAATATAIGIHNQQAQVDQFQQNIASVQGRLQTADSTLGSVVTALTQAISVGIQGGNSSLSPANRTVLSGQIQAASDQVLALANTNYQGSYIFAGSASSAPAFIADPLSASGVTYQGNTTVNQVEVSAGQKVATNVAGSQIFSAPSADVFGALHNLAQAVQSGNGVDTAVTQLRTALDHVSSQRSFYGSTLQRLDSTNSVLNGDKVDLGNQENTAIGIDLAQAATNVQRVLTARQALLAAGGKIQSTSLLDFLPST